MTTPSTTEKDPQLIWRLILENMEIVANAFERLYEDRDIMQRQINELRATCLQLSMRVALDELFPGDEDATEIRPEGDGNKSLGRNL